MRKYKQKKDNELKRITKKINREIENNIYKNILKFKGKFSSRVINKPFETVWVPVNSIKDIINKNFAFKRTKKFLFSDIRTSGMIIKGNWDKCLGKIEDSYDFIACVERFSKKKMWEDTIYRPLFLKGYGKRWGAETWEEFKKTHLYRWDKLYLSIQKEGYLNRKKMKWNKKNEKEIEVGISRNGEILFIDGIHRIAIAKILNIKKIPVIVNVWHKEYINWIQKNTNIKNITPRTAIKPILDGTIKQKFLKTEKGFK